MNIEECYQALGGEYAKVEKRLLSARLVKKFVGKFLDDDSYTQLCDSMRAGRRADAFRAAHTLKGVCQNLGFDDLATSAGRLTEALRPEEPEIPAQAFALLEAVEQDYAVACAAIRNYLESEASGNP